MSILLTLTVGGVGNDICTVLFVYDKEENTQEGAGGPVNLEGPDDTEDKVRPLRRLAGG